MKQAVVVDSSLKLPKGKLAAQVAHASLAAYLEADEFDRAAWLEEGMPKVVLKVGSHAELVALFKLSLDNDIPASLIEDAGRTVVPAGTITCLGLGPAPDDQIDRITAALDLL